MPGEEMDHRKERMKSDCKTILESINAMCFENLNDEQVHALVMMREIARGVLDNRLAKVSSSDVKKALSSSIDKMVESCRDVVSILGRISCEGLGEEEFQKLGRMKEIAMGIVLKRSTAVAAVAGEAGDQGDGGDDDVSEKDVYSGGVEVEGRSEGDQNEVRQGVVDGEIHMWNGYVPIIEGAGEERKMAEENREVVSRDEGAWNVGRGSLVEGTGDAGHQEQTRRVEGLMFEDDCLVVVSDFETQDVKSELQKSLSAQTPQATISWPSDDVINLEWVQFMMFTIEQCYGESPQRFCDVIPVPLVDKLIDTASSILCKEPNCVEVDCQGQDSRVVVVGDIYGQFHDLLRLFEHAGLPSDNQSYVFNGNYVDKGAHGLDIFLVLLAWKVLMPSRVYLLRGNHESRYCTSLYGFEEEVKTKFGHHGEYVYNKCLNCFKELPLASVIVNSVYTTHGGLFRSVASLRKSKRKREESLELGSLEDLSKVKRALIDAPDVGPDVLLTDVLWSDPSKEDGLVEKTFRERGLWWGPDCTEAFLKQSNLKLIIRSHEGPDVRETQDEFGDMLNGYSMDHVGESGKLYTLFSAPDYPQCGETRYKNEGVYALLKPPNFESPSFHSFKDVERRQANANGDKDPVIVDKPDSLIGSSTGVGLSLASGSSEVDFKALGISNPPSSSVMVGDGAGATQLVQVPKAPMVEGLPLPLELQVVDVSGCDSSFSSRGLN
ncbi:serine/threonine-protein phosphatase 7-like [Argentina anserina]|uniref:serine/threonine-protein phosphatase 7-like n=1 Tax=Argentina anserina TaxID=57926 RepID=UPI0021766957|nr:serine/threonine-protein phosphatase 7-like [Potentilla anserina]XP_050383990.1 serine/threonine-protein phosphatase 7-like [Potentilla anserina]